MSSISINKASDNVMKQNFPPQTRPKYDNNLPKVKSATKDENITVVDNNLSVENNVSKILEKAVIAKKVIEQKKVKKKVKKVEEKPKKRKRKLVNKNRRFSNTLNNVEEKTLDVVSEHDTKSKQYVQIFKDEIIDIEDMNFDVDVLADKSTVVKAEKIVEKENIVYKKKKSKVKKTAYKKQKKRVEKIANKKQQNRIKKSVPKKVKTKKKTPKKIALAPISKPKKIEPKKVSTTSPKPSKQKPGSIEDGKKTYLKKCKLCHGKIETFVQKYNADKLQKIFVNDGERLRLAHEKSRVSKLTSKFYKSKDYSQQVNSLKEFVMDTKKQKLNEL